LLLVVVAVVVQTGAAVVVLAVTALVLALNLQAVAHPRNPSCLFLASRLIRWQLERVALEV